MNLKKLAKLLLIIGVVSLILGGIIGAVTFDADEFKEQAAEYKASYNKSDGNYNDSVHNWRWKKDKWNWFSSKSW